MTAVEFTLIKNQLGDPVNEAFRRCDAIDFRRIEGGWEAHFKYGTLEKWVPLDASHMTGQQILDACFLAWLEATIWES